MDTSTKKTQVIIPIIYDDIRPFSESKAAVRKDELWGYIDSSGKTVVPLNYLNAGSFHNGLAVVAKEKDNNNFSS
ncbi:WG repeat-containing protein [Psychrobacter sp. PAMC 21119]|uniref:WG repeat-containing protein n=1 Tax=Psychrobacter sp. PAMC 21119 TaxID=1112209 RepID=UPI000311CFB2